MRDSIISLASIHSFDTRAIGNGAELHDTPLSGSKVDPLTWVPGSNYPNDRGLQETRLPKFWRLN